MRMRQWAFCAILLACTLLAWSAAGGQRAVFAERVQQRNEELLRQAMRPLVVAARRSVVTLRCSGRRSAMGTIVSADGWIVSKASELSGKITCEFFNGRILEATIASTDDDNDLALLKVDATDLHPIQWSAGAELSLGQLLATAGSSEEPIATGVVSVARRFVPSHRGMLGVQLEESQRGPKVVRVVAASGAARVGIRADDVILEAGGVPTPSRVELLGVLQQHRIGTKVRLKLLRDGKEIELAPTMGPRPTTQPTRSERMNQMGGPLSSRSAGFPDVFQTDTVLNPADCGSPLLDLDGRAVGINIARAGRTETYAIPADVVIRRVKLMQERAQNSIKHKP